MKFTLFPVIFSLFNRARRNLSAHLQGERIYLFLVQVFGDLIYICPAPASCLAGSGSGKSEVREEHTNYKNLFSPSTVYNIKLAAPLNPENLSADGNERRQISGRNNSPEFLDKIPWDVTFHIEKAQKILIEMYLSLNTRDKEFADKYLLFYLPHAFMRDCYSQEASQNGRAEEILKGDTDLPSNYISKIRFKDQSLFPNKNLTGFPIIGSISQKFKDQACIYCFIDPEFSINKLYIGQTQEIESRLKGHYWTSIRKSKNFSYEKCEDTGGLYNHIIKSGGIDNLYFNVLINFPTFQSLYVKEYGQEPDPELKYILQSFTEFKLGIYEQALISHYKPGLNKAKLIQFTFNNWVPGTVKSNRFISFFSSVSGKEIYDKFISSRLATIENEAGNTMIRPGSGTKFNFLLYYELCKHRNINPMEQFELEWLVGYIERKGIEDERYDTKSLTLSSKNQDFLLFIFCPWSKARERINYS